MLTKETINSVFAAFVARDLDTVMEKFTDDAVLFDPHYPQQRMVGRDAIRQGLTWGLANLVKPGFAVRSLLIDGDKAAIEVDTHHIFKGGIELRFEQVFMVEARDGKFCRLQSYAPYGPPGMAGAIRLLTRWVWKLQGRLDDPARPM